MALKYVRAEGLEPTHLSAPDPKSGVSTNSTTPAGGAKIGFTLDADEAVIHGCELNVECPRWRRSLALCSPCFQHIRYPEWCPQKAGLFGGETPTEVGLHWGDGSGVYVALWGAVHDGPARCPQSCAREMGHSLAGCRSRNLESGGQRPRPREALKGWGLAGLPAMRPRENGARACAALAAVG